jgi:hypothetical protein
MPACKFHLLVNVVKIYGQVSNENLKLVIFYFPTLWGFAWLNTRRASSHRVWCQLANVWKGSSGKCKFDGRIGSAVQRFQHSLWWSRQEWCALDSDDVLQTQHQGSHQLHCKATKLCRSFRLPSLFYSVWVTLVLIRNSCFQCEVWNSTFII